MIEDNSEPVDEADMSFLNDVLEQYHQTLHQQGLRTRMTFVFLPVRPENSFVFFFFSIRPSSSFILDLDHLESQATPADQPPTDVNKESTYRGFPLSRDLCMRLT